MWPSEWLREVLSGYIPLEDAPASIQSWARLEIFNAAEIISNIPTKAGRNAALQKVPERIRPHVQSEVVRLWAG